MKFKDFLLAILILVIIVGGMELRSKTRDVPIKYIDELPGISGTPTKPDTAICYVLPGTDTVFIAYLHPNNKK